MDQENLPVPLIDNHYENLVNVVAEDVIDPTPRDIQIIEEMAAIGCTPKEICGVLKIPPDVLKNLPEAKFACERGHERMKVSLRRLQWKTAQKNPVMQIFLGKQILGQADKVDVKDEGKELDKARAGFMDKLKNTIDVTPKRTTSQKTHRKRKTECSPVSLGTVGEGAATSSAGELA